MTDYEPITEEARKEAEGLLEKFFDFFRYSPSDDPQPVRVCDICCRVVTRGYTDHEGTFYTHKGKCFRKYMNRTYGKHGWMKLKPDQNGDDITDEYGGYFIVAIPSEPGYEGTGIFYTEWEE